MNTLHFSSTSQPSRAIPPAAAAKHSGRRLPFTATKGRFRLHLVKDAASKFKRCKVRSELVANKFVDFIKSSVGNMVMVSGGRNRRRVGVIRNRAKYKGSAANHTREDHKLADSEAKPEFETQTQDYDDVLNHSQLQSQELSKFEQELNDCKISQSELKKIDKMEYARKVFDVMTEKGSAVSNLLVNATVTKRDKVAAEALTMVVKEIVEFDQVTLVAVLSACAELCDLSLGKWFHSYVAESLCAKKQSVVISLYNSLIHMYASCGVIGEAYEVFNRMPRRTTISWTSMITGFAKQGYAEEALGVFQEMERIGGSDARPDEITFLGVLSACSHAGYVDEGRHYFKRMSETWGIEPNIEHYGCMVDLLSRAGLLDEAERLVKTMPIKPNDAVWGALLGGCRIHKNVELASNVAENLALELNPNGAAGYLVLMSNVYSTAKKWKDVVDLRRKMLEMGVRKPPGRSWIEIDGVIHDFLAGDETHKHTSSIYEMLGVVTKQGKFQDFDLDNSEALQGMQE